jgi:glycosyltransferase involved in cell wall biosynthesis
MVAEPKSWPSAQSTDLPGVLSPDGDSNSQVPSAPLSGRRILFIMPSIPLQGMERASIQIMRLLAGAGATVMCLTERTYGASVKKAVEQAGCQSTPIDCIHPLRIPRGPYELAALLRARARFAKTLEAAIRSFVPTHFHVTNLTFFLYSLPALRRARRPIVFRIPNPPDHTLSPRKHGISNWIWTNLVTPRCDAIVCNSMYSAAELRRSGACCDRVTVIHNCITHRPPVAESDAPTLGKGRFHVVYIGRIQETKGVAILTDVAERMLGEGLPIEFWLAGQYNWRNPFADVLIQRMRRSSWGDRIHFLGEIEDVNGLLDQANVHVHPARAETFGNVLLEAKARSVPSVVFDGGSNAEIVEHLVDGYVCGPQSAERLYEGLRYFLDQPKACQAAGQAAKASLERFSPDRITRSWIDLYQGL